jgi:hypothetical protein
MTWRNTARGEYQAKTDMAEATITKEFGVWCLHVTFGEMAMTYQTTARLNQAQAIAERFVYDHMHGEN